MPAAEPTADEPFRLAELRALSILDTPREAFLDDIVVLATRLIGTPMSLISLVDESRQWFKAAVGLEVQETSREIAFCAHAILDSAPLVVPDAMRDPRFADNPLVTGPPGIRFYAGIPLALRSGARVGTLCIIDTQPRQIAAADLDALGVLARHVSQLLDCRQVLCVHREVLEHERVLERRALDTIEDATERLAVELHDGLGQELIGARLLVDALQTELAAESGVSPKLEEIATVLRRAVSTCRELAHSQTAFLLKRDGLIAALQQFGLLLQKSSAAQINVDVARTVEDCLTPSSVYHLYRIAQEGILNAVKHAQPERIDIHCVLENDIVRLRIEDDGGGIIEKPVRAGIGLENVRFRVKLLGARFTIKPRSPTGTLFCVDLPRELSQ